MEFRIPMVLKTDGNGNFVLPAIAVLSGLSEQLMRLQAIDKAPDELIRETDLQEVSLLENEREPRITPDEKRRSAFPAPLRPGGGSGMRTIRVSLSATSYVATALADSSARNRHDMQGEVLPGPHLRTVSPDLADRLLPVEDA